MTFTGHLNRTKAEVWLRVEYFGDSWLFANRIKLAADDFRWTSQPLKFERDNDHRVWEVAYLPYRKGLVPILRRILDSKAVIIRFEGKTAYEDLVVTDEMKNALRLMMDALAAIKVP